MAVTAELFIWRAGIRGDHALIIALWEIVLALLTVFTKVAHGFISSLWCCAYKLLIIKITLALIIDAVLKVGTLVQAAPIYEGVSTILALSALVGIGTLETSLVVTCRVAKVAIVINRIMGEIESIVAL